MLASRQIPLTIFSRKASAICRPAILFAACLFGASLATQATVRASEPELSFEREIRTIFREHCFDCHGATKEIEGGLDLRQVRRLISGGDSGPAIDLENPHESILLDRIRTGEMPPGETRVPEHHLAIIEKWLALGAPTLRPEPEDLPPGLPITEEERSYWAYQPIVRPEISDVSKHGNRIRTPIDALLAASMPEGLTFSEDADRFTLIQRVYFDLIGLPPNPQQIQQWMSVPETDWYEQLVEHLLDSPQYGERWGRHWLDAVGYADSEGHTISDGIRPWAWRYRDYVIKSLNQDKPWNTFLLEQLAGDELAGPKQGDWTNEQIEYLTATGFLRMAADGTGSGDNSIEARNKTIADTLQIIGSSLLATSFNCAQCHDHRYDPISHRDYFALRAVFTPSLDWQSWQTPQQRLVSLYTEADRTRAAEIEAEVQKIATDKNTKQSEYMKQALDQELMKFEEPLRGQLRAAYETSDAERTDEQKLLLKQNPSVNITPGVLYQYLPQAAEDLKKFDQQIAEIRAKKPAETFVRALTEPPGHAPPTHIFHRGDPNQPTDEVQPGPPAITSQDGTTPSFVVDNHSLATTGRRTAFAQWLTSPSNPLTPRALVNRVWLHHFGRGIVATPGEFGRLGAVPSHPELLDWLAAEFAEQNWSLKHLHRIILNSTAWRQTSKSSPAGESLDAENTYYWRRSLQRLDAETLRDSTLAVSGTLDLTPFGPPIPLKEDETGQVHIESSQPRRSVYVMSRRSQPVALLQAFDAPVMSVNCEVRPVSTVATQALLLLNGEFAIAQAEIIAGKAWNDAAELAQEATEAIPEIIAPRKPIWSYGTGSWDETSQSLTNFTPLPHFTGSQWQGGPQLPDPKLGWVLLTAQGGHPGNPNHPAVRRWTAPTSGRLTISGTLSHGSDNGDGVRARVIASGHGALGTHGVLGTWQTKNGNTPTPVSEIVIDEGATVDFMVDCIGAETSDSFNWPLTLTFTPSDSAPLEFKSANHFQGPIEIAAEDYRKLPSRIVAAWQTVLQRTPTLDELRGAVEFANSQLDAIHKDSTPLPDNRSAPRQVLINLCQMLINSNEFLYVE